MRYSNLFLLGIHKVVEPQIMNNNIPEHNEDIHLITLVIIHIPLRLKLI